MFDCLEFYLDHMHEFHLESMSFSDSDLEKEVEDYVLFVKEYDEVDMCVIICSKQFQRCGTRTSGNGSC